MVFIEEIFDRPWESIQKKRVIEHKGGIPKIIHFVQKFFPIRREHKIIDEWKNSHPDWLCLVWKESDAMEYISEFHPSYKQDFQNMKITYHRMDAFRLFILHDFGGVCTDLTECTIDLETQLREEDRFVTFSNKSLKTFFISIPNQPCWKSCWREAVQSPWNNYMKGLNIPIRFIHGSQEGGESSLAYLASVHEGWIIGLFVLFMVGFYLLKKPLRAILK